MTAQELLQMTIELRERENLLDVGLFVTRGKRSDILWLSRGTLKRNLKKKLRKGVAEAFLQVYSNGDGRWRAYAQPLPGIDPKRASHLIWQYGIAHKKWEDRLN